MKDFSKYSDEQLAALSVEEEVAFSTLVDRYEERLRRYVHRISAFGEEEVEEILQDTFLAVWKNIRGFDERVKFSSWVYRIAHNQTISLFRKFKTRGQDRAVELTPELYLPTSEDFVDSFDNRIDAAMIQTALQELPTKYREVLVLRFFEDLSYDEMADILKCSIETVSTLVARARKKFRVVVQRLNITFSQ